MGLRQSPEDLAEAHVALRSWVIAETGTPGSEAHVKKKPTVEQKTAQLWEYLWVFASIKHIYGFFLTEKPC